MRRALRGLLLLTFVLIAATQPVSGSQAQVVLSGERQVYVFLAPGVSFEEMLSVPNIRAVARTGGAGLMSLQRAPGAAPFPFPTGPGTQVSVFRLPAPGEGLDRAHGLVRIGDRVRSIVPSTPGSEVLVIVASMGSSPAMAAAKDDLHPVVLAEAGAERLFHVWRPIRALTWDSTRRAGVVSDLDLAATVDAFLGAPPAAEGSRIRIVNAPAPVDLHERYLAMRRMAVPLPAAAGVYVTLAGLFAVAILARRDRVPPRLMSLAGWLSLTVPILAVALLAAGHLPTLSYATVLPFVIGVTVAGTLAVVPLRRFGTLTPPAAIGAGVLVFFAVEAALGWTAALTPFLGGSELDGGRFYGLPNEFIGLLIGASLYLVAGWKPWSGFVVIVSVAMFAGLPGIGANLGGAVSLFAAGGLWLALRSRGRLGWRGLALAGAVVVVGTGAVLLANRFLASTPTHITRFEEAGGGLGHVLRTIGDRLLVGWRLIVRNPFALVPVLGVPASLFAVLRPATPVREALERHPEWRDAILVILLASAVAYLANDSGAAACGLGFGLGLGGLLYVSCAGQTWKMDAT